VISKPAIAAGAVVLVFATTIAPAIAVWRGSGGGSGGMHAWHSGGFYGAWHGGYGFGLRRPGWGWGPVIGLGILGGYAAGSAIDYGYGAYDYSYDAPYGYGYGGCVVYEPVYNPWGVMVGRRAVNVC
jgi:hypothetical protein